MKYLISFAFLFLFVGFAYAGDIPESFMYKPDKPLFVGRLTEIGTSTVVLTPTTVMIGKITNDPITVKSFTRYYGTDIKPKAGDILVAVLTSSTTVDDLWIFKATSLDYRTLKLVSEKYEMVKRYEQYINEGKYFGAEDRWATRMANKKASVESETSPSPVKMYNMMVLIPFLVFGLILVLKRIRAN